ncbi:MAG: hypothetical protein GX868_15570 [Actinobacteria bacterium]|nr:hypothetical protein [Actinomycetota bacterium]
MAHFAEALTGWVSDSNSTGSSSTGDNRTGVWNLANRNVIVNVSRDGNGDTEVNLTYSAGAEQ